jgi:type IV secretory pathway TrbF-like protein
MQDKDQGRKEEKPTSNISNTYINKVDQKETTPYLIKMKKNGKMIAIKANKQDNKGNEVKRMWVPNEIISNMRSTKKVWVPRRK